MTSGSDFDASGFIKQTIIENQQFSIIKQNVLLFTLVWGFYSWMAYLFNFYDLDFTRYQYAHPIMYVHKAYVTPSVDEPEENVTLNFLATMRCTRATSIKNFTLFSNGRKLVNEAKIEPMSAHCPMDGAPACDWFAWWIRVENVALDMLERNDSSLDDDRIYLSVASFSLEKNKAQPQMFDINYQFTPKGIARSEEMSKNVAGTLTVCVKTLNFQSNWLQIIDFLENWHVLGGVGAFQVYWHSVSTTYRSVLRIYQRTELIELIDWSYLPKIRALIAPANESVYMANEHTACNDCLVRMRHSTEYITMLYSHQLLKSELPVGQTLTVHLNSLNHRYGPIDFYQLRLIPTKTPKRAGLASRYDIVNLWDIDFDHLSSLNVQLSVRVPGRLLVFRAHKIDSVDFFNNWFPDTHHMHVYRESVRRWSVLAIGSDPMSMRYRSFAGRQNYPIETQFDENHLKAMNKSFHKRLIRARARHRQLRVDFWPEQFVKARQFEFKHRLTFCPSQWMKGPATLFADWLYAKQSWTPVVIPTVGKYSAF